MKTLLTTLLITLTNTLIAQENLTETPAAASDNMWQTFMLIGTAVIFFYFILYRPEQKRRKALESQRESLKKGDKVAAVGIIGIVSQILDNTVILRMYDGSKIEVLKAAITEILPSTEDDAKKIAKDSEE